MKCLPILHLYSLVVSVLYVCISILPVAAQQAPDQSTVVNTLTVDANIQNQIAVEEKVLNSSIKELLFENRISNLSSNIDGAATLIDSFLTDVEITSLLGGIDGDDKTPISFDYNFHAFGSEKKNSKFHVVLNTNAKVSDDVAAELGTELTSQVLQALDDLDDIEVGYSLNLNLDNFGNWKKTQSDLFTAISKQLVEDEDVLGSGRDILRLTARIDRLPGIADYLLNNGGLESVINDCAVFQSRLEIANQIREIKEAGRLCHEYKKAYGRRVQAAKRATSTRQPYVLAELLANQPKLQFSVTYLKRDDAIGANEFSVKTSYSFGGMSLSRLLKNKGQRTFLQAYNDHTECLTASLLENGPSRKDCGVGGAFSIALEYSDIDDQEFGFSGVSFVKKGGSKLIGSVAYDRTLVWDGAEPVFDIAASLEFEEFLSNTKGNDRVLATLTLTRKVNDRLSIPFSIQYANKSEFLEDVDSKVSANLGIKYDFNFSR